MKSAVTFTKIRLAVTDRAPQNIFCPRAATFWTDIVHENVLIYHKSVVLALHQCKSGYLSLKNIILSRYVLIMLARTPFVCVKYLFPHFPCRAWTILVNFCPWDLNLSASSASAASDFVEPWLLMAGTTKIAVFSRHHDCTGECPRLHGLLDCVKSIQTSPINPAPFPAKCW